MIFTMIPIAAILFFCIWAAVEKMTMFDSDAQIGLAICVTLLCLFALHQTVIDGQWFDEGKDQAVATGSSDASASEDDDKPDRVIPTILLPYAALGLTLLLLPFLLLFSTAGRTRLWQKITQIYRRRAGRDSRCRRASSRNINKYRP